MAHHHENEETILCNLIYLMDMGSYDGHNVLFVPSLNLKISVFLNNIQKQVVQAIFSIEHPEFEEDIIESVAGVGENTKKALESASNNFYNTILVPLLEGLKNNNKENFENEINEKIEVLLQKKLHIFKKYESDLICIGNKRDLFNYETSLFDIIKDKLSEYLGTKKAYIIKIFASYSVDKYICEVRINGVLVKPLTDLIEKYSKTWEGMNGYYAEKQCVFLLQEDFTYEICPYTRQEVIDLTLKLIKIIETGKTFQDIESSKEFNKKSSLIKELIFLIPEIYCEVVLNNLNYNDIIVLERKNGNNEIVHTTQMRNYNYVKEAIYTYFEKNKPSDSDIFKVISLSKRYIEIDQEFKSGKNFENIDIGYLRFNVDENYKLF